MHEAMANAIWIINAKYETNMKYFKRFSWKLATNAYLSRNLTLICSRFLFFLSSVHLPSLFRYLKCCPNWIHWHIIEALIATINILIAIIFLMHLFPFASDSCQLITISYEYSRVQSKNRKKERKKNSVWLSGNAVFFASFFMHRLFFCP